MFVRVCVLQGLFLADEEWRLVLVQLVSAAGHPESVADYVRVMNALVESSNLKGVFTVFDKLEEVANLLGPGCRVVWEGDHPL